MWKIGTVRGYNRGWTSDIYTEKTPDFSRFKYSFNKRSLRLFLLYPSKNEKFNQNIIHWTITLITPLFGIVHFKTNYNYRLSNHCFINELILVTYALISNAVEKDYHFLSQQKIGNIIRGSNAFGFRLGATESRSGPNDLGPNCLQRLSADVTSLLVHSDRIDFLIL